MDMLLSHLKLALRNLRANPLYSVVNITGLAVAIACTILFALLVRHEWSYDRMHADSDRIYRAWAREDWGEGRSFFYTLTPIPMAPALENGIPEVEATVRIREVDVLAGPSDRRFNQSARMVDEAFLDVFDFELLAGSRASAFAGPNHVVITPDVAARYFPGRNPVGQILPLEINGRSADHIVGGVIEPAPAASSIQYDLLLPFSKAPDLFGPNAFTNWFSISVETYVLLRPDVDPGSLQPKLESLIAGVLGSEATESGYEMGLQPLPGIHLGTDFPQGIEPISDPVYSYFLVGIAGFLLAIACMNFVTLSVGQAAQRGREVGVRKALGAARGQLAFQYWGEALLVVSVAVATGIALAMLLLPWFNAVAGESLALQADVISLLVLLVLVVGVGAAAGFYPAVVLSSFRPIETLRGRLGLDGDRATLRRALIVVQFAISFVLITGSLFVVQQLDHIRSQDLGYDKEQVVVLRTGMDAESAYRSLGRLRNDLSGRPEVVAMAASTFPLDDGWARVGFDTDDGSYAEVMANLVSPEFTETMGIDVIAGRPFALDRTADSTAVLVNEAYARAFGYAAPAPVVGTRLPSSAFADHEIVGVVRDFNFESLHEAVRPLVLVRTGQWLFAAANDINVASSMSPEISIRIAASDVRSTIDLLENTWTVVGDGRPFDFYFLDAEIDSQYLEEERLSRMVGAGATLAVLIACMGLFGLAAVSVVRRRKEIGIRKVLGASVPDVIVVLGRDFAVLVVLGLAVAAPVAYVAVDWWLENFAYRIEMSALTFAAAGALVFALAAAAVSYQSIRAALTDPVRSLRYE